MINARQYVTISIKLDHTMFPFESIFLPNPIGSIMTTWIPVIFFDFTFLDGSVYEKYEGDIFSFDMKTNIHS